VYPEKFTRDSVIAPFFSTFHCHLLFYQCGVSAGSLFSFTVQTTRPRPSLAVNSVGPYSEWHLSTPSTNHAQSSATVDALQSAEAVLFFPVAATCGSRRLFRSNWQLQCAALVPAAVAATRQAILQSESVGLGLHPPVLDLYLVFHCIGVSRHSILYST